MTCKGIRPDGNQCTCPDEYTRSGLCASCAAPGSTALVPVGSTDMMADPEVAALYEALPPKAQQFIKAYVETLSIDAGAEAADVHRNSHYYWKKNTRKVALKVLKLTKLSAETNAVCVALLLAVLGVVNVYRAWTL